MPTALLQTDLGALPLTARGKVRDIYALSRRSTPLRRQRPHLCLRPRPRQRHPRQRQDPHPALPLLVRLPEIHRPQPPHHRRRLAISHRAATIPRANSTAAACSSNEPRCSPSSASSAAISPAPGGRITSRPAQSAASNYPPACANPTAYPNPSSLPPQRSTQAATTRTSPTTWSKQTIGAAHADALRTLTLEIYDKATKHAASKGVILADTKFEFGLLDDTIILADEVLTPDSSRYWPAATYNPGGPQPSFDKQYVRDYLESIHWNKQAPAPASARRGRLPHPRKVP